MAPLRPGSKPGKIGHVVSTLGCDIARGAFAVGASLPAEHDLELRYGASRGVVREAVKILAGKGLVSVGPRLGTRVRPQSDWSFLDHDVLGWLGRGGLDRDILLALDETRRIIEPAAAALAADRATAEQRQAIRAAYDEMAAEPDDLARATEADKAFHLTILDATHNPVLGSFRSAIDAILSAVFEATVPMLAPNLPNHEAVAAAIERRDPDGARTAMERLLERTRRLVTEGVPASADAFPPPCGEGRADAQRPTGMGVVPYAPKAELAEPPPSGPPRRRCRSRPPR